MVNKQETNQIESFADLFAKQIELDDKVEGKDLTINLKYETLDNGAVKVYAELV